MKKDDKKKILICDDDKSILEVMTIILEENNFEVKTLSSGKAIQERVKQYLPNLILLDIWMPGIDGKEITKLLKRDKQTKNIPIIVISALNQTGEIAKKIGADGFLSKPFDIKDLIECVEKNTK